MPLSGTIVMELHEDIGVPSSIAPSQVQLSYRADSATRESGSGKASDVSLFGQDEAGKITRISITHDVRVNNSRVPIPAGAEVTVLIRRGANVTNPVEGGSFTWKVAIGNGGSLVEALHPDELVRQAFREATPGGDDADVGLLVDREIQLSHEKISRGQTLTVTARGYSTGYTLTVWRDANINGLRDGNEVQLCRADVNSRYTARCSFSVYSSAFVGGLGQCVEGSLDCNFINAVDSVGRSSIVLGKGSEDILEADQALELVGGLEVNLAEGPGGQLRLKVFDFPPGTITEVSIGGVATEIGVLRIVDSGELLFSVQVPNEVRLGRQYLRVVVDRDDNEGPDLYIRETIVDISQPHTIVRALPEAVLPNQRISLSGLNFSENDGATIEEVRFGSFRLEPSRINDGSGSFEISADGKWSGSVDLPIVEATTTRGTHNLWVKDSMGRTGSVDVTVPPREVELVPGWGRPGTVLKVKGTGFPTRNVHGSSVTLRIHYDTGERSSVVFAEPDAKGNFSQDIQVPRYAPTPSSNTVRVEFYDDNGSTVTTTAPHEVPGAEIRLSPASGPPGTIVEIQGSGFMRFVPVASVSFSGMEVSAGNSEATDSLGEFSAVVMVPGMEEGRHTVQASVAGIIAAATFEITPSGVAPGVYTPIGEALKNLGDRLVRVFHFNNDTKLWTFYEPSLGEADVFGDMTLNYMVSGETYMVQVTETNEVLLNGRIRNLSCLQGNCWNVIVW